MPYLQRVWFILSVGPVKKGSCPTAGAVKHPDPPRYIKTGYGAIVGITSNMDTDLLLVLSTNARKNGITHAFPEA